MKTLTKNNRSLYIFDDTEAVTLTDDNIIVGNPVRFIIGDCDNSDTVLHEGVTPPADWTGRLAQPNHGSSLAAQLWLR